MHLHEKTFTWAFRAALLILLSLNIWITYQARDSADDARAEAIEAKEQASYCVQR